MSSALFLCPKCTHLPRFPVFWEQIHLLAVRLRRRPDAGFSLFALCWSGALGKLDSYTYEDLQIAKKRAIFDVVTQQPVMKVEQDKESSGCSVTSR